MQYCDSTQFVMLKLESLNAHSTVTLITALPVRGLLRSSASDDGQNSTSRFVLNAATPTAGPTKEPADSPYAVGVCRQHLSAFVLLLQYSAALQ
jgi:hypothetical protein